MKRRDRSFLLVSAVMCVIIPDKEVVFSPGVCLFLCVFVRRIYETRKYGYEEFQIWVKYGNIQKRSET